MKPTAISLFSGAGGMDHGFSAAGFETAVCVEIDDDACRTLEANGKWNVLQADILTANGLDILTAAGVAKGDAHALIGGPPCQPFSKSGQWARGRTLRLSDPRAATIGAFMRVWQETLPQTVVLENVAGFLRTKANDAIDFVINRIREINELEGTAYDPEFRVLNAADYGVPQMRKRFFLVAHREGRRFQFPEPAFSPADRFDDSNTIPSIERYRTAWDAIGDLQAETQDDLKLSGRWAELLPSIPEGKNYLHHTNRGAGLPLFGWRRRYWSFLLKLAKDRPAWTIQAEPGPATGPFHWHNRRLSVRELCRLQTFPDDVIIRGNDRSIRRQIGNAVPSLLAEVIARDVLTQFLDFPTNQCQPTLLGPRHCEPCEPEPVRPVEPQYLSLIGTDAAHPGPGQGRAAVTPNLNAPD